MIYPNNFEKKIGFDEIRHLLKQHCISPLGVECVDSIHFETKIETISEWLRQVTEFRRILSEDNDFPCENFYDMRSALQHIRPDETYLDEMELFDLKRSLDSVIAVVRFLKKQETDDEDMAQDTEMEKVKYPALFHLVEDIAVFPDLVNRIGRIIDVYGKIKDNASSELARIRREMASVVRSISVSMNSVIQSAQKEGFVEKNITPTLRDGRLVIPVAPALKRKIKGIVHDESATGKTIFIEPTEVVEANNRVRELNGEERREIIRILKEISAEIRPQIPLILPSYRVLGEIDCIRAKALLAEEMGAIEPVPDEVPQIDWVCAVHPILERSLRRHNKHVVPLDICIGPEKRILIISGPNAGGKSVCLKTVGLLQYMLQCGVSVSIAENSKVGLFDDLFIDIGDEQSIEDDLSTYSSHLLNMKQMMKFSNARSLLLIDEFGGGTEPLIGGAMAEAILLRFIQRGAVGVITTHYQNLKMVADKHVEVVNGAMLYDRNQMRPLFQLQIGNPGSSFAVEIARKIGIPEEVIADASKIVGTDYIQSDKYLQDIVRDKRYWENKRQQIRQREKNLEQQVEHFHAATKKLEEERKTILTTTREEAGRILKEANARIENTIRTIRETQAEKERTKLARQELADFHHEVEQMAMKEDERIARKMEQLKQRQQRRADKKKAAPPVVPVVRPAVQKPTDAQLAVGDYVRIKGQQSVGKLMEIERNNAIVLFGQMRTSSKLERLEKAEAPKQEKKAFAVQTSGSAQDSIYETKLHFKPDIDVRGMRGNEALTAVTYFIDDAILLGMSRVRILHGTGTGALRSLIRDYLSGVRGIAAYRDEHVQFGGSGITVVDLE